MRIFVLIGRDIEPDLLDPVPRQIVAIVPRHVLALETEGDVVEHRAVIERRVVLKHHAAIGAGTRDGLAEDEHVAGGGGMLRIEAGDETQDRALAAAAGAENADELALVRQIGDDEVHVANGRERVGLSEVVGLGDVAKLDDVRNGQFARLAHMLQDLRHADVGGGGAGFGGYDWSASIDNWTKLRGYWQRAHLRCDLAAAARLVAPGSSG